MKIGDVAERTQVATRLIRYYEQQGLLTAARTPNGYRTYTEADVGRVSRVAGLVQAGIPTRLVKVLLEAEDANARNEPTCPLAVAEQLASRARGTGGADRLPHPESRHHPHLSRPDPARGAAPWRRGGLLRQPHREVRLLRGLDRHRRPATPHPPGER